MSKKFIFGVIGLAGVGLLFLSTPAKAAAQEPDSQTRALLGQTLTVLQATLNKIDARIKSKAVENPQAVSASLGGIKSALVVMDTYLKSVAATASENSSPLADASPAAASDAVPQTATVSWFVGPKLLLILLPVAILVLISFSLFRKRKPEEEKTEVAEIASEIKTA